MRFFGMVFLLLLTGFTLPAARAAGLTDAEIKALPAFCEARLKRTSQYEHWNQTLGPDFAHTHHYCEGLGLINRYYAARTSQQKKYNLQGADADFSYMVQHASQTYSLMPEVYLNLGLVSSLMGRQGEALTNLKKAQELNPQLVKAYTLAAEVHTKLNQNKEALNVVTEGLRQVPDSAVLQRLYKERGGKLPYPEPVARAAPTVAAPVEPGSNAKAGEDIVPTAPDANPRPQTPASPAPDAATGGKDAPVTAPPKIGSPTNPWCRFCPDPAP